MSPISDIPIDVYRLRCRRNNRSGFLHTLSLEKESFSFLAQTQGRQTSLRVLEKLGSLSHRGPLYFFYIKILNIEALGSPSSSFSSAYFLLLHSSVFLLDASILVLVVIRNPSLYSKQRLPPTLPPYVSLGTPA